MKIHSALPLALVCVTLALALGWPAYQHYESDRAMQQFFDLQQRLVADAVPIHATGTADLPQYSCTSKNGFIHTSPSRAELRDVCAD